jgi:hypothetical protein
VKGHTLVYVLTISALDVLGTSELTRVMGVFRTRDEARRAAPEGNNLSCNVTKCWLRDK